MDLIFIYVLPVCMGVSWSWFMYSIGHYVAKERAKQLNEPLKCKCCKKPLRKAYYCGNKDCDDYDVV